MPIPALGAVPSQSGRTASTKNAEVTWEGRQVELKQLSFHAWCHPLRRLSGICVCQVARVLAQSSECLRWNAALAGELRMGRSRGLRFQKPPIWYPQIIFFYTLKEEGVVFFVLKLILTACSRWWGRHFSDFVPIPLLRLHWSLKLKGLVRSGYGPGAAV